MLFTLLYIALLPAEKDILALEALEPPASYSKAYCKSLELALVLDGNYSK